MEASLEPRWWQKLGLRGLLVLVAVLIVATYLFYPSIQQPGTFTGQVLSIEVTEHPKTGFRQLVLVKLTTGDLVQARVSLDRNRTISEGDVVTLAEYKTLGFHKRKFVIVPDIKSGAPK